MHLPELSIRHKPAENGIRRAQARHSGYWERGGKVDSYETIDDITALYRALSAEETDKAKALLPVVSADLRYEARKIGKDLDQMIAANPDLEVVAKSVTVDVVARALMTPTEGAPMTQTSESALGYSVSGTYLVPGGGLFIKKSELARLGLRRQKYGGIDLYGTDTGDHDHTI